MDMQSLNSSLPSARRETQLVPAFKEAAVSVTKLYKIAAAEQSLARSEGHAEGFQDALISLLSFLDQENLGLGDGEGWRIRQWITSRIHESTFQPREHDSEEDHELSRERSSSSAGPEAIRNPARATSPAVAYATRTQLSTESTIQQGPIRPTSPLEATVIQLPADVRSRTGDDDDTTSGRSAFTFRSSVAYPERTDTDMTAADITRSTRRESHHSRQTRSQRQASTTANNRSNDRTTRTPQKRKAQWVDYFDIGEQRQEKQPRDQDYKDGGRGPKARIL